jgi:hypothetical protein
MNRIDVEIITVINHELQMKMNDLISDNISTNIWFNINFNIWDDVHNFILSQFFNLNKII